MDKFIPIDKNHRVKKIKNNLKNNNVLFTYKLQKRFLHFFWITIDSSLSLNKIKEYYNLELIHKFIKNPTHPTPEEIEIINKTLKENFTQKEIDNIFKHFPKWEKILKGDNHE